MEDDVNSEFIQLDDTISDIMVAEDTEDSLDVSTGKVSLTYI